jgi:Holliday junction resolvase RusA-like endonuclease
MERIEVIAYGKPMAKPRPRFSMVGPKIRTYTPGKAATWELEVGHIVRNDALLRGYELPIAAMVRVTVDAVMPRPKNQSRKADPEGLILRATRPDLDNVMKSVCDALMKGGVIVDDAQVVELSGRSLYSEKQGEGRTIITLEVIHG